MSQETLYSENWKERKNLQLGAGEEYKIVLLHAAAAAAVSSLQQNRKLYIAHLVAWQMAIHHDHLRLRLSIYINQMLVLQREIMESKTTKLAKLPQHQQTRVSSTSPQELIPWWIGFRPLLVLPWCFWSWNG